VDAPRTIGGGYVDIADAALGAVWTTTMLLVSTAAPRSSAPR
jgi:hypothetical protein